ncbi:ABC transporter permease [Mycobacterium sp. GA-2829]|uniref:ABC transporter permease n=1 Tax=Mycobacterium sp. GA-2829 TaxID=1772283 RepID=UPI0007403948|nr:ABC transporter permease [Mycobacterium sp. GA-2829]KUI23703.1 ABC transporter permease [Mycobacterium sp. GA-2829]
MLRAEQIKLRTTRAPLWTVPAVLVLSLGLAVVQASVGSATTPLAPERIAIGVATFGVPVLMVLAALTVTGEYRTGLIRTTFLAMPVRTRVLGAKAVVTAVFSGVCAAVMVVAAVLAVRAVGTPDQVAELSFTGFGVWRTVGAIALYAALGAVLAVALGVLVRHSAGVVAILLLLPFVVEPLLGAIPKVGARVGPLLPFANVNTFTEVPWVQTFEMWWGPRGALLYFTGLVAVVFAVAAVDINRRDP